LFFKEREKIGERGTWEKNPSLEDLSLLSKEVHFSLL